MSACPCGTGRELEQCCKPFLSGKAQAPTAEALMRARYTAYATGAIDFVEKTQAPETREGFDREASLKWSKESDWKGLHVVATKAGKEADKTGIVSFIAEFAQDGKLYRHEEIATFRKGDKGEWLFVDGQSPKPETYEKTGPDVGRNDPCHCGSGKKFKKCHGR